LNDESPPYAYLIQSATQPGKVRKIHVDPLKQYHGYADWMGGGGPGGSGGGDDAVAGTKTWWEKGKKDGKYREKPRRIR
jgi:hypothetical protein